jgi:cytochrome c
MRSLTLASIAITAALGFVLGCNTTESPAAPETAAAQIERGGKAFGQYCARCHGDAGQGTSKAPPLVGAGVLPLDPRPSQKRTVQFHNALDVAKFATANMPPDKDVRAGLKASDYWAVLAFDLNANGIKLSQPLTAENAASFVLHP